MATIPITKRGAEKLKAELHKLKTVDRPWVINAIAEARAQGDLSENAEYEAAKDRQGFIEGRIQEVDGKLSAAQIIDPTALDAGGRVVFGATVGLAIDRLIARYGHISPVKALFFQAIGAERIEAVCDLFCADIQREYAACGYQAGARFSPGYGDFPLSAQRDIFRVLDCSRKIGLSLNSSLLMSPSKSVTAIIGLSREKICGDHRRCGDCHQENCEFRSKK